MSNLSSFDPGIPVLTEVFQEPAAAAPNPTSAIDWEALERRLFEQMMETMHGQIEVAVERAIQQVVGEIRQGVRVAVREVVEKLSKQQ